MANYPTSLDTITNPTSGNTLDNPSHSLQHSDANDILEALETKLGIGASPAGSATSGHALVASTGGTTSWTTIGTAGISSGAATNGQVLTADGSGGVSYTSLSSSGLVLLNTTSFSAVASQSVNDVFSSTYDNYRIVISYTSATGSATRIRWRVSGSDNTTTNYNYTGFRSNMADGTTGSWTQTADGNDFHFIGETTTSDISSSVLDVFRPFATAKTNYVFSAVRVGQFYGGAGYFNATTSFTGFTIYSASGNMTGSVSIYGYNK